MIRTHNRDIENGVYRISAFNTLPSREDPREFTSASLSLGVQIDGSTVTPSVTVATASNAGPFLKFIMEAFQGPSAGQRLYAELSAVLYCRAAV